MTTNWALSIADTASSAAVLNSPAPGTFCHADNKAILITLHLANDSYKKNPSVHQTEHTNPPSRPIINTEEKST
jgi:hypothetical protein